MANPAGDPAIDWYGEGIASLVRDNLAQSRHLSVVFRTPWQENEAAADDLLAAARAEPSVSPSSRVELSHLQAVIQDPGQSFSFVLATPRAKLDRSREVLLVWPGDIDAALAAGPGETPASGDVRIVAEETVQEDASVTAEGDEE